MVQTEIRLVRGRLRCVQRGTMGFWRWRALEASADDAWAICLFGRENWGAAEGET